MAKPICGLGIWWRSDQLHALVASLLQGRADGGCLVVEVAVGPAHGDAGLAGHGVPADPGDALAGQNGEAGVHNSLIGHSQGLGHVQNLIC